MDIKSKERIALFRYGILSPFITGSFSGSAKSFYMEAASKTYDGPDGNPVSFHYCTIERWHRAYIKGGFDALKPKGRNDFKHFRHLSDDTMADIRFFLKEYPRIPATVVYQKLLDNGTILKKDVSLSTVTRYINICKENDRSSGARDMHRYEKEHINELWCGDSSAGPYIKVDGVKKKTYIIALIDDASRFIVGIDIFFNDNFINLMSVIRSAVSKYGKPKMFNFDNGANYRSAQMNLLSARLGTAINYNPVHTPTSKAKIERWFRTMKDHWMASINYNDFHSLDELRQSLLKYVQEYNQSPHSSLDNTSPIDRFFSESALIIRLSEERINTTFLIEIERKVSNDNVVIIDNEEYEVDYRYGGRRLLLRYAPDLSIVYIVNEDDTLTELKLLNKIANSSLKRQKVMITKGSDQE